MERNENGIFVTARDVGARREGCGTGTGEKMPRDDFGEGIGREAPIGRNGTTGRNASCTYNEGDRRQLAMVYAPMQCFRMLYDHSDALMRGTLFEELDKPLEEVR